MNLLDPMVLLDPYPLYRRLRAEAPVVFNERLDAWLFTDYASVAAVSAHPDCGGLRLSGLPDRRNLEDMLRRWMLHQSGAAHEIRKKKLRSLFTPAALERRTVRISGLARELLRSNLKAEYGRFDFVAGLARPLPFRVIAELVGLPAESMPRFQRDVEALFDLLEIRAGDIPAAEIAKVDRAVVAMREELRGIVRDRAVAPAGGARAEEADTLIAHFVEDEANVDYDAAPGCDRLEDFLADCVMLLGAGYMTAWNQLGNGMAALMNDPVQWSDLARNPARLPAAIEEMLRFDAALQCSGHIALRDLEISGVSIPAGARLYPLSGAANRDPQRFSEPDRFDVSRESPGHLAFGRGAHFCIGAGLFRAEAKAIFTALIEEAPRLTPGDRPTRRRLRGLTFRGFESLELSAS